MRAMIPAKENVAGLGRPGDTGGSEGALLQTDCIESIQAPQWQLKWQRILASFLTGRAWHALDAVQGLHTTCLNSDVSGLESRGLRFDHERRIVAGYRGVKTPVVSYRLRPESYSQARRLLGLPTPSDESAGDAREYLLASRGSRG